MKRESLMDNNKINIPSAACSLDSTSLEFKSRRLRDLRDGKPVKVHRAFRVHAAMPCCGTVAPHISIHIGQIPKTRKLSWSEGQCDMHQCHVSQDPEYAAAIGSKLHEKDWGWFCWDGIHALVAG